MTLAAVTSHFIGAELNSMTISRSCD